MWIFSKHGFFSAVCAREGSGGHGNPVDPTRIMVRARVQSHLEALQSRFPELLGASEIKQFPGTDYAFRVFISKALWQSVLAALAEEIDYDNFKSEVARHRGALGSAYEPSLHEVWSVMYGIQRR
jgi:hypothetical protein